MGLADILGTIWPQIANLAPYHLLIYSTLLGTELYQTFVVTKICFTALPRPAFIALQKRLFPVYFQAQSTLLVLAAVTFPPGGVASLARGGKSGWVPFVVAGVTAGLNLLVYGPRTRKVMLERAGFLETRDGVRRSRGNGDGDGDGEGGGGRLGEQGAEMQKLNRAFSTTHAMSIHLNLISVVAMVFYGWRLALRLDVSS
ncbi:hypothetical protein B0T17DRAFT_511140 [Bombardia bombarda]|uniref:TMEM205-like domain-containing protein n=1 Tax=Bombardia bombarda TaxID=252184 RepID=A0AA39WH92_9PEZI|nr:hypothetical protein B0T17DRAFT_511140 [Bombardia bombarda]